LWTSITKFDTLPLVRYHESRQYAEVELGEACMEFRLTYQGPLLAERDDRGKRSVHKHEIRRKFHEQLLVLWEKHPSLYRFYKAKFADAAENRLMSRAEQMARRFEKHGIRWAPLVHEYWGLACSLNILFLRPEPKGGIVQTGDLDNRIKLLFDALAIPQDNALPDDFNAASEPNPFFCLLSDDSLITSFSVTADRLLVPDVESSIAHLVIEVKTLITDHDLAYGEFA